MSIGNPQFIGNLFQVGALAVVFVDIGDDPSQDALIGIK